MKKIISSIALCLCASIMGMAQSVTPFISGMQEGAVYYLPKTEIQLQVVATRTDFTPGEYADYALRYLRVNDAKGTPSTSWKIKEIRLTTVGVADTSKVFITKVKDKNAMSSFELTPAGVIKAINITAPQVAKEPALTLEKSAPHEDPRKYMTEEILLAGSKAKMAELCAREIYNIRESKNNITRGNAETMPKDGASLDIVLTAMSKQESALTSLFVGSTQSEDVLFTFRIAPEMGKDLIPFRFSTHLGVVDPRDLSGEPVYLTVTPVRTVSQPPTVDPKAKKLEGVIYNVPGEGRIKLMLGNQVLKEMTAYFTQLGSVEVLAEKLFDKKVNTRVLFDPVTGGIQKIDKEN